MSRFDDERDLLVIVDRGAEEDAAWDKYRYSPQYAIDKAREPIRREALACLDVMAEALQMPFGDGHEVA